MNQPLNAPKRALIVIDVQNEYFNGKLCIEYPDVRVTLPNICRAMDAATAAGIPVVVVQHLTPPGAPVFARGSDTAALHPEIARRPHDLLVEKTMASALTGTPLGAWLRERGIDTLSIVGYMTHNCDDSTARQAYLPTEAASLPDNAKANGDAVLPAGDLQLAGRNSGLVGLAELGLASGGIAPGASRFPGENQPVFVHEPEMEEAAIRFANGDAEGAEANLRDLLAHTPDQPSIWMMLFDLFRATGQQQKFESAALDYAVRFDRLAPLWCSLPEMTGELLGARASAQGAKAGVKLDRKSVV